MRLITALLLVLALSGCGRADADRGSSFEEARDAGEATLRVLYVPAEGWAHTGDGDRPRGVTADLVRGFAKWLEREHGIELSLDFVAERDWQVFYGRVRDADGGVLGLGNVTITDA